MKKIALLFGFAIGLLAACQQKEELIPPQKEPIKVVVDTINTKFQTTPRRHDFRDSLVGTYRMRFDSSYSYGCLEYGKTSSSGSAIPDCLKYGFTKDYNGYETGNMIISYDVYSQDVFSGTAPVTVSGIKYIANQKTKELLLQNSNEYASYGTTIRIKGNKVYTISSSRNANSPFENSNYYSGYRIK